MDYLNLDNSVRSTERATLAQSRCSNFGVLHSTEYFLINREMEIRNSVHLSIHASHKTNVPDVTIEIQIRDSDVGRKITGLQMV